MTRRIGMSLTLVVIMMMLFASFAWAQTPEATDTPTPEATQELPEGCPYGNYVDNDGDGVCDYLENDGMGYGGMGYGGMGYGRMGRAGMGPGGMRAWPRGGGMARMMQGWRNYADADEDGICDNFTDEDGDGVCDNCNSPHSGKQGRWNRSGMNMGGGRMQGMDGRGMGRGWNR